MMVEEVIKQVRLEEKLKDITRLTTWQNHSLGDNQVLLSENLVLVIRGDLLRRYPNAIIYAIDAVPCDGGVGEWVPGLPEYLKEQDGTPITDEDRIEEILTGIRRIFPVFRATLPPDLSFFGFPFGEDEVRSGLDRHGKYLVIEEQVSEPRFGLDSPSDEVPDIDDRWDDLSWSHFGFGIDESSEYYGVYLDAPPDPDLSALLPDRRDEWLGASAARRALITCQKPVRVAIHADQMLPPRVSEVGTR